MSKSAKTTKAVNVASRALVLRTLIRKAREVSALDDPDGCDIVKLRYAEHGRDGCVLPAWADVVEAENVDLIERVLKALGLA